jgi:hypothetical protein
MTARLEAHFPISAMEAAVLRAHVQVMANEEAFDEATNFSLAPHLRYSIDRHRGI